MAEQERRVARPPSTWSGLLYGLGLGGFVDGIVLHQILQWHHMVSDVEGYPVTTLAGLEVNTLADGFFHAATWLLVLGGSIVTISAWRQGRLAPNLRFHFGLVLAAGGSSTSSRASSTTSCWACTMSVTISARPCPGTSASWSSVSCSSSVGGGCTVVVSPRCRNR